MSDVPPSCPFCKPFADGAEPLLDNGLVHVRYDIHPVNPGHVLVIPNRHVESYFDLGYAEKLGIISMLEHAQLLLVEKFNPAGFNIGINIGVVAGQTVPHVHAHLIPRYPGDVDNPRGGVRGVIPGKQSY